jgi:hypothetical protein
MLWPLVHLRKGEKSRTERRRHLRERLLGVDRVDPRADVLARRALNAGEGGRRPAA